VLRLEEGYDEVNCLPAGAFTGVVAVTGEDAGEETVQQTQNRMNFSELFLG